MLRVHTLAGEPAPATGPLRVVTLASPTSQGGRILGQADLDAMHAETLERWLMEGRGPLARLSAKAKITVSGEAFTVVTDLMNLVKAGRLGPRQSLASA
jgi:hypothetical protein